MYGRTERHRACREQKTNKVGHHQKPVFAQNSRADWSESTMPTKTIALRPKKCGKFYTYSTLLLPARPVDNCRKRRLPSGSSNLRARAGAGAGHALVALDTWLDVVIWSPGQSKQWHHTTNKYWSSQCSCNIRFFQSSDNVAFVRKCSRHISECGTT